MSIESNITAGYLEAYPVTEHRTPNSTWLDLGTDDTLIWVTPWLGPSATIILHRFCTWFKQGEQPINISLEDVARTVGLVYTPSTNDRFIKTLQRLALFNLISFDPADTPKIWVKTHLTHLPQQLINWSALGFPDSTLVAFCSEEVNL